MAYRKVHIISTVYKIVNDVNKVFSVAVKVTIGYTLL